MKVSSKWKRVFFMSLSCHKMNYSSVPNKWNKRPHLLFSKKYLSLPLPPLLLLLGHPLHTHTHTHTRHTNSHTHASLIDFSFFFEKKSEKWGSNFQMKCVNSGYSSYTHLYALFFHSMHVGFLWSYSIWIKLGKYHLPSWFFYFDEFFSPNLLLRPSVIEDQGVGF